jgi:hypothetical protein
MPKTRPDRLRRSGRVRTSRPAGWRLRRPPTPTAITAMGRSCSGSPRRRVRPYLMGARKTAGRWQGRWPAGDRAGVGAAAKGPANVGGPPLAPRRRDGAGPGQGWPPPSRASPRRRRRRAPSLASAASPAGVPVRRPRRRAARRGGRARRTACPTGSPSGVRSPSAADPERLGAPPGTPWHRRRSRPSSGSWCNVPTLQEEEFRGQQRQPTPSGPLRKPGGRGPGRRFGGRNPARKIGGDTCWSRGGGGIGGSVARTPADEAGDGAAAAGAMPGRARPVFEINDATQESGARPAKFVPHSCLGRAHRPSSSRRKPPLHRLQPAGRVSAILCIAVDSRARVSPRRVPGGHYAKPASRARPSSYRPPYLNGSASAAWDATFIRQRRRGHAAHARRVRPKETFLGTPAETRHAASYILARTSRRWVAA